MLFPSLQSAHAGMAWRAKRNQHMLYNCGTLSRVLFPERWIEAYRIIAAG